MRYGDTRDQSISVYPARSKAQAPVVLLFGQPRRQFGDPNWSLQFLIGGLVDSGVAVVGFNLPAESVADDAANVRSALAFIKARASTERFDLSRIAIVGHGSGAHLAGLVATDSSYLESATLSFQALRGAVLLDGWLSEAAPGLRPQDQISAPNAPVFLIVHPKVIGDNARVIGNLAADLRKAGSPVVERTMVSGDGIAQGSPSDRAIKEAFIFLRNRLK